MTRSECMLTHRPHAQGDTDRTAFSAARKARVIVTTPEKWDSLTRLWSIYAKILDHLVLFLVDEVHMLHEKERGECVSGEPWQSPR